MSGPNVTRSSRALFVQLCPYPRLGTTEGTRARLPKLVASDNVRGYRSVVAANSATGRRGPSSSFDLMHNRQPKLERPALFVWFDGGCARDTFGYAEIAEWLGPRTRVQLPPSVASR